MDSTNILDNQHVSFNNFFSEDGPFSRLLQEYGEGNKVELDDEHSLWLSGFEILMPAHSAASDLKELIRANRTLSADLFILVNFEGPLFKNPKPARLLAATIPCPTTDSEFVIGNSRNTQSCRYTMTMQLGRKEDIDKDSDQRSLLNRRVLRIGDILEKNLKWELASYLSRPCKKSGSGKPTTNACVKETWQLLKRGIKEGGNAGPRAILPKGFLQDAVDRIFNPASNSLFQLLDTTNPLAEVSQKRRVTLRGPGGIPKEGMFLSMRDVHPHDLGCICPAETPQGIDLGCTLYLARGARINEAGLIETAMKDRDGNDIYLNPGNIGEKILSADPLTKDKTATVQARSGDRELFTCSAGEVDLQFRQPDQILGYAAALIPFIHHDDANRCLMGANMMKQAVAIEGREPPLVQTGVEKELGQLFKESAFAKDDIFCFGHNLLTAYMPWDLLNYEDAVVVSESACEGFTHKENQELIIDELYFKKGNRFEEITRKNPWLGGEEKEKLDEFGVIRSGEKAGAGDVLVSRVEFAGPGENRLVSDLVMTALGRTYRNEPVRNKSIRVPDGLNATVSSVTWEVRKGWDDIFKESGQLPPGTESAMAQLPDGVIRRVRITLDIFHRLSTGDKLAGRHGNKGIVGKILPERNMPYCLTDKPACTDHECMEKRPHRHIEIIVNPLTITGRLNLGQLYETSLGLLAESTGTPCVVPAFSRKYSWEAIKGKLDSHGLTTKQKLFFPDKEQKVIETDREVTVGFQYFMKLKHLAADKMKARPAGVLDQVTGQPATPSSPDSLQKKLFSRQAPQRLGEMEVWALMGHGAWNIIDELQFLNSDEEQLGRELKRRVLWPEKGKKRAAKALNGRLRERGYCEIRSTEDGLFLELAEEGQDITGIATIIRSLDFIAESDDSRNRIRIAYDPIGCKPRYPRPLKVLAQYLRVLGLELEAMTAEGETYPFLEADYNRQVAMMRIRIATDEERMKWASANIVMKPGASRQGLWSDLLFGNTRNVLDRDAVQNEMGIIMLENEVPNPLFLGGKSAVPKIRNLMVLPKALRPERNENSPTWRNGRMPPYENDLNILYSWILRQNARIRNFKEKLEDGEFRNQILENEKRRLRQLVTALLVNKKMPKGIQKKFGFTTQFRPRSNRPMQSILSKITGYNRGKDGLVRKNLLGKRINFSARAVIVPEPGLSLDQAGLPVEIGHAIFRELLLSRILAGDIPVSITNDNGKEKNISERDRLQMANAFFNDPSNADKINEYLSALSKEYLVLLNRNPSLHRLSILAFKPVFHEKADVIMLNPWVCAPFNADFDGDTMSVFLPVRKRSQEEAASMLPSVVLRSPANGRLVISNRKDMALAWRLSGEGMDNFSDILDHHYRKGSRHIKDFLSRHALAFREILTKSGVTLGVDDFLLLPALPDDDGSVPDESRLRLELEKALQARPKDDSLRMIYESGAVKVDLMQLSGFRGYMRRLDDTGKDVPILSNLSSGMSTLDYFVSCHGSRAGLADKGLVIRVAGDLMNCMVQACQAQRIVEYDCGTEEGFYVSPIAEGDKVILPLSKRITGRCLARDYTINGKTYKAGTIIDAEMAREFEEHAESDGGCPEIAIRSPLVCRAVNRETRAWKFFCSKALGRRLVDDGHEASQETKTNIPLTQHDLEELIRKGVKRITLREENNFPQEELCVPQIRGICRKCYGIDPATGKLPETGSAIGILAAQSIGEAGSQMTLRTFHTGGAAYDTAYSINDVRQLLFSGKDNKVMNIAPADCQAVILKSGNGMKWLRLISSDSKSEWRRPIVCMENGQNSVARGELLGIEEHISIDSLIQFHGNLAAMEYVLSILQKMYSSFSNISDQHFETLLKSICPGSGNAHFSLINAGKSQGGILPLLGFRGSRISLRKAAEENNVEYLYGLKARLATGSIVYEDNYWNDACGGN